jgi:hypothetical protein
LVIPDVVADGRIVLPAEVLKQGPLHEKTAVLHPAMQVAVVFAVALGEAFGVILGGLFGALLGMA